MSSIHGHAQRARLLVAVRAREVEKFDTQVQRLEARDELRDLDDRLTAIDGALEALEALTITEAQPAGLTETEMATLPSRMMSEC